MATSDDSDADCSIPMRQLGTRLVEDEYGYVDPGGKISMEIMMQLPSNQIEDITDGDIPYSSTTTRKRSLKRSETRYKTMKLKKVAFNSSSLDDDVEKVYEILTCDPDVEESEIKSNLRDLYQSLTVKRMVKAKIDSEQETRHRLESLNCCARLHYRLAMSWQKFKSNMKDLSYSLELWHGCVKKVQGHSGSGVASYFIFLRWLLYLNVFNFIIAMGFIVTPQIIFESSNNFDTLMHSNVSFSGYDLLTGSGWLGNSSFFYGHYTNETIEVVPGYQYNMPMAYLCSIGMAAIINLFVVAYSVTKAYQAKYVNSSGEVNRVCEKVFCAWDFSIEKLDTAALRQRLIYFDLMELLSRTEATQKELTCCSLVSRIGISVGVNTFVIFSIAGIGYLVYYILESKAIEVNIRILGLMTLALMVTAISFVFHHLISYATKLEYFFSKHTQLYLLLGRVAALRIVILSIVLYFWLVVYAPGPNDNRCYESLLGEEIYRLIIVNFLMNVIFCTCFGEFFRKVMSKDLCCTRGMVALPKFDVAYNTNDLIYFQTLVWIGSFFCPLLPLLVTIILVLLFYIKLYSVTSNCQPSQKSWSSAEAQTLFLVLALVNFLLTVIAVGYTIFRINPSYTCGPFQNHDSRYGIIAESLNLDTKKSHLAVFLQFIGSPALFLTIILMLCVAVYFARAHAVAHEEIVKRIRQQLVTESKDKVFLLHLFESAYREHMNNLKASGDYIEQGKDVVQQSHCESPHEIRNPVYRDYYTGKAPGENWSSPLPISPQAKYDPGYLKANVPANFPHSPVHQPGDFYGLPESMISSDLPTGRPHDSPGFGRNSPKRADLLPRPVHKQGFQYLIRGEPPPRASATQNY